MTHSVSSILLLKLCYSSSSLFLAHFFFFIFCLCRFTEPCANLSIDLSVFLSFCLSVYLKVFVCLSVCLPVCLSVSLFVHAFTFLMSADTTSFSLAIFPGIRCFREGPSVRYCTGNKSNKTDTATAVDTATDV